MKLHFLQHVEFEGLGSIEKWITYNGHDLSITRFFKSEPLPEIDSFDGLIIMGGVMSIDDEDEYPWLKQEKEFIRKSIEAKIPVLGICFGAQLLADTLGAKVYKNHYPEIGWYRLNVSDDSIVQRLFSDIPKSFDVLHWHGDTFDIPQGALLLAGSEATPNQGFIYKDKILAMQFHLELRLEDVSLLMKNCGDELIPGKFIQRPDEINEMRREISRNNQYLDQILTSFFDM